MTVHAHALTDIGLKRTQNEDHHACWVADAPDAGMPDAIAVVADGMGGALAGEIASRLAVDVVMAQARELGAAVTPDTLRRVVEAANHMVHADSVTNPDRRGMGTTCTALVVRGGEAVFAHVGDSRAYLVRDGAIRQLTRDHSLVAQLVEFNHLTPEEAKVDPRRNVVTRSLGVAPVVEVDAGAEPVEPGDRWVLTSDGLHGLVEDPEILEHAGHDDLERACRELVELAKARGGHDNITVIVMRIAADAGRRKP